MRATRIRQERARARREAAAAAEEEDRRASQARWAREEARRAAEVAAIAEEGQRRQREDQEWARLLQPSAPPPPRAPTSSGGVSASRPTWPTRDRLVTSSTERDALLKQYPPSTNAPAFYTARVDIEMQAPEEDVYMEHRKVFIVSRAFSMCVAYFSHSVLVCGFVIDWLVGVVDIRQSIS